MTSMTSEMELVVDAGGDVRRPSLDHDGRGSTYSPASGSQACCFHAVSWQKAGQHVGPCGPEKAVPLGYLPNLSTERLRSLAVAAAALRPGHPVQKVDPGNIC